MSIRSIMPAVFRSAGSALLCLLAVTPLAAQTLAPRATTPGATNPGSTTTGGMGTPQNLGTSPAGTSGSSSSPNLGAPPLVPATGSRSGLGSSTPARANSFANDPEMLDSPLRYLVRLKGRPQIVSANGTRWLDIQFHGEGPRLAQQRDQLKVTIQMAYADGSPLKDRNQVAMVGDSIVGTEVSLAEADVEVRGDTFQAAMFFPLNDLDLIGDSETPLQVELILKRGNLALGRNPFTPEKHEFVTIPAADMPRMWVQSLKVEVAKNADGASGVSATGMIYLAGQENTETVVEMAVANAQLAGVQARDPRFRVTDNWAGQGQKVKPTKNVQSFRLSLFVPFEACQLSPGKQELGIYVRAFNTAGNYIGGTPPEPLMVTVP